jgi:hypothetical protein
MSRNRIVIGVVIAVAAIVAAVVWGAADSGGGDGGTLAGTSWTLTDLDSGGVTGTAPTLELTETDVSGTGGCNTFSGTYTTDGDTISFGPLASTMMACEPSNHGAGDRVPRRTRRRDHVHGRRRRAVDLRRRRHLVVREGLTDGAARRPVTAR